VTHERLKLLVLDAAGSDQSWSQLRKELDADLRVPLLFPSNSASSCITEQTQFIKKKAINERK